MPRKTHVNAAQVENLHKWQQAPRTMVKDAEDSEFMDLHPCPPSSHACPHPDESSCRQDDITSDLELLDIVGVLRGAAMISITILIYNLTVSMVSEVVALIKIFSLRFGS